MIDIGLEGEQLVAFKRCVEHLTNNKMKQQFLIFGAYAGTGKTFTLKKVTNFVGSYGMNVGVIAFTGRAVSQLKDDNIDAITAHSLLYKPKLDHKGVLVGWERKEDQEILEVCSDGIIVDEGSMFPYAMHRELESLNIPIIYSGDFGQLPPVDQENPDFNCMTCVDGDVITLVENQRFDINSGIGFLSLHLRDNNSIPRVKKDGLRFIPKGSAFTVDFHKKNTFDIVLCGTNRTRKRLNNLIRAARGYVGEIPEVGETVICLRNGILSNGSKINNGELFTVEGVFPGSTESVFILKSEKGASVSVRVDNESWFTEASPMKSGDNPLFVFGFGYAASVHKAQGSTFKKVLFVDEDVSFFLEQQKFRYTGITRASDELTITI